jgi:hypothetical protein
MDIAPRSAKLMTVTANSIARTLHRTRLAFWTPEPMVGETCMIDPLERFSARDRFEQSLRQFTRTSSYVFSDIYPQGLERTSGSHPVQRTKLRCDATCAEPKIERAQI